MYLKNFPQFLFEFFQDFHYFCYNFVMIFVTCLNFVVIL